MNPIKDLLEKKLIGNDKYLSTYILSYLCNTSCCKCYKILEFKNLNLVYICIHCKETEYRCEDCCLFLVKCNKCNYYHYRNFLNDNFLCKYCVLTYNLDRN